MVLELLSHLRSTTTACEIRPNLTPPAEQLVSSSSWWSGSSWLPLPPQYTPGTTEVVVFFFPFLLSPVFLPHLLSSTTFSPTESYCPLHCCCGCCWCLGAVWRSADVAKLGETKVGRQRAITIPAGAVSVDLYSPQSSYGWAAKHRECLINNPGRKGGKTCVRSEINQEAWGRDLLGFLLSCQHPDRKPQPNNERKLFSLDPDHSKTRGGFCFFSFLPKSKQLILSFPSFPGLLSLFHMLHQASSRFCIHLCLVTVQRWSPYPSYKVLRSDFCSVRIQHSPAAKTTN